MFHRTADLAADYLETLEERPVGSRASRDEVLRALGGSLPERPEDPAAIVEALHDAAARGTTATGSGRFFGFVVGGALPSAIAVDWLTSTWDQNAGLFVLGPTASVVEEVAGAWLCELFGLPVDASVAFVTGCQMAHVTCLAAARHDVLERAGWDVEQDGLAGAPPIRIVAGAKYHVTVEVALRFLGMGRGALRVVPADAGGRMVTDGLRDVLGEYDGPTIVCAQAGEVNTGAFDDLNAVADAAADAGAWMHVDGAFGLWAAAGPATRHLVDGVERADSWATDAHKWLNVPYDCGLAFTAHPQAHLAATSAHAEYLMKSDAGSERDESDWTPDFSRRARGYTVYAAIRALGRQGVVDLVERTCRHARELAEGIGGLAGCEVLNDVVLNQVLLRFADDETTDRVLAAVQDGGEAWPSGTTWDERRAIRLSVSNWRTSDRDVARTVEAFRKAIG
ncbi:MAG TPA: pyridoxal-dependent decarboxylase [Actinomycetota bacterium]